MKHASWMTGVLVLALNGGALAAQTVTQPDFTTPSATLKTPATPVAITGASDDTHRQAITTLFQERQAFVQSFNWNSPGDPQALRASYAAAMERFDVRELELKRDWYRASGQTELLARTESTLEKRQQAARALPEIAGERRTPSAPLTQEVAK